MAATLCFFFAWNIICDVLVAGDACVIGTQQPFIFLCHHKCPFSHGRCLFWKQKCCQSFRFTICVFNLTARVHQCNCAEFLSISFSTSLLEFINMTVPNFCPFLFQVPNVPDLSRLFDFVHKLRDSSDGTVRWLWCSVLSVSLRVPVSVCVSTCICVCMSVYVYVCTCICVHVCVSMSVSGLCFYLYLYVCASMSVSVWVSTCFCVYVCASMSVFVCVCTCVFVHVCASMSVSGLCFYLYPDVCASVSVSVCLCFYLYLYVCLCQLCFLTLTYRVLVPVTWVVIRHNMEAKHCSRCGYKRKKSWNSHRWLDHVWW